MYNSNRYHIMLTRTPERRRMHFLVNPCEPMPCQPKVCKHRSKDASHYRKLTTETSKRSLVAKKKTPHV